jgi:hypothetical protein
VTDSEIRLIPGPAGWVQARFYVGEHVRRVFVRFEPDAAGRWKAAEWRIPHPPPEPLPWRRIVKAVDASDFSARLFARFQEEAEPGFVGAFGEARPFGKLLELKRPAGRRLDGSFYAQVAMLYRQAVGRGLNPRQTIAEQAGVSTDVAGRWIYEARKRKLIPKTTPGKVTT